MLDRDGRKIGVVAFSLIRMIVGCCNDLLLLLLLALRLFGFSLLLLNEDAVC